MTILFVTIAWPLPGERNLYSDLMSEFILNGHEVYVLGTQSPDNELTEEVLRENGIDVLRIKTGKIRKTSHLRKAISLLTLNGKMLRAVKGHLRTAKIDLIIGPTPPVTLSPLFKRLKKLYGAPFYLLLKDIWPQGSVDLKVLRKYSLPWLWLRTHEKFIYKTADYIGCMSPMGVDYILSQNDFISKSKIEVCPNTICPTDRKADDRSAELRSKYNIPPDACVFIFSGNLGIGHGLGFLVEAIRQLADFKKAFFVIGGSGTQFRFLADKLKQINHQNFLLYEWLPREDFNRMMEASDVGLILLSKYTVPQFPSRLLSYFDYSKPVLCAVNNYTDIGKIVEISGCGRSVIHGDLDEFIAAVKYFSENRNERIQMGKNGNKLLLSDFTVTKGYEIIMRHFADFSPIMRAGNVKK